MSTEVAKIKPFRFPQYTFGCEMECIGGRNTRMSVIHAVRDAGFRVANESYVNRYNDDTWVVGFDGSLDGQNAMEIKTPILKGIEGLDAIRRFTKVLNDMGVRVNRSCGLHVHVGILNAKRKFRVDEVHTVLKRYAALKPQIDLLMAKSRRTDENEFCRDFSEAVRGIEREISHGELKPTKMLDRTVADVLGECGDHYDAVSVAALSNYGTIEFRQHHGTVNGQKITNWIRFLLNFIEMSRLIATANRRPVRSKKKSADTGRLAVRRALAPQVKIALPEKDDIFAGQTATVVKHFQAQKARLAEGSAHTRRRRTVAQAAASAE